MFALYLFALILGGGLLLFSLFGDGHHHGADASHHDLDVGDAGQADMQDNPVQWLSLRTVIYFLFVFGGVGAALSKSWPGAAAPLIAVLATGAGAGVGAAVSAAF